MDDPAYKRLFSRPRMVRDLLRGFAARGWSAELDLASLTPLPASYVSHDLRQRHGDLVWRVRFKDDRWLYVVLLLEFQSAVDRSMAVRMLTYTALLYQKLIADGVLRERSALPVVMYNGRPPWTAPVDVAELIASGRRCGVGTVSAVAAVLPAGRGPGRWCRPPVGQPGVGVDRTGDDSGPAACPGVAGRVDRSASQAG